MREWARAIGRIPGSEVWGADTKVAAPPIIDIERQQTQTGTELLSKKEFDFATATKEEALVYALSQLDLAQQNERRRKLHRMSGLGLHKIAPDSAPSYICLNSDFDDPENQTLEVVRRVRTQRKLVPPLA